MVDLPLADLWSYNPEVERPEDFDEFWDATLEESRARAREADFRPHQSGLTVFDVFDVRFSGFGGDRVAGWLVVPTGAAEPLPAVVQYLGYGGGRGFAFEHLIWAAAGYAQFVMDNRGQGARLNGHGDTSDAADSPGPQAVGYSTRGLLDPRGYVYRRLYTDAVLAVDAVTSHPAVDPRRVAVTGTSLGGASALAAAALHAGVAAALIDVPALCHPRHSIQVVEGNTYKEIWTFLRTNRHLVDQVFRTLSYVDGVNFAARAVAPAFFSAALMDPVVPPSGVFAAYNRYRGRKQMAVWEFNQHESGGAHLVARQMDYLRGLFGAAR